MGEGSRPVRSPQVVVSPRSKEVGRISETLSRGAAQREGRLNELVQKVTRERVTLVFGARDPAHNNAVVLKGLLEELQKGKGRR